jgi:hypothetical protein
MRTWERNRPELYRPVAVDAEQPRAPIERAIWPPFAE